MKLLLSVLLVLGLSACGPIETENKEAYNFKIKLNDGNVFTYKVHYFGDLVHIEASVDGLYRNKIETMYRHRMDPYYELATIWLNLPNNVLYKLELSIPNCPNSSVGFNVYQITNKLEIILHKTRFNCF